ncbi:MAG: hypothetical protein DCC58_05105 [Chloroflexi bacterium]|nr:MAG: hypothetical protein DCC58_05105 [Chloroflexota bacterium]
MVAHFPLDDNVVRVHRRLCRLMTDDALRATRADAAWLLERADAEAGEWPAAATQASRVLNASYVRAVDDELRWRSTNGLRRQPETFGHSRQFLDELLQQVDLVAEVELLTNLRPRGRALVGVCPFHDDHDPSLTVWPGELRWRCWAGCGFGDVIDWVLLVQRGAFSFRQAVEYLSARYGVPLEKPVPNRRGPRHAHKARVA